MQFATGVGYQPPGASNDLARQLLHMVFHEPVMRQVTRLVQNHCLSGGLHMHFASNVPPTPNFARHIEHYYTEFCRDAIFSCLAVGFVPYRVRRLPNGAQIPEVLPLGTYTWYVARGATPPQSTLWQTIDGRAPPTRSADEEAAASVPMLRYEVSTVYCKDPIHVYEYERPNPQYQCSSAFYSLLPCYLRLCQKRECSRRADTFNSQPSIVFEQQNKVKLNDIGQSDAAMLNTGSEARDEMDGMRATTLGRQTVYYDLLDAQRDRSLLPDESVAIVAPMNHAVHSLDRVLSPQEMIREELQFVRNAACVVGLPPTLVLQGSGSVGSNSASSSSNSQGWAESTESNNRELLDLCRHMNRHMELLLQEAYGRIYQSSSFRLLPTFRLVALPIFNLEQLMAVFNARLIDDGMFSAILEASFGAPLGADAAQARTQERSAEFVLPFRDKKKETSSR